MRGEHQVHPQRGEQLAEMLRPGVPAQLGHGGGQRLAHRLVTCIAFPQVADALMLFGQVGQVEVDGEGPGDLLGRLQAPGRDQLGDLVPGPVGGRAVSSRAGRRVPVPLAAARLDHGPPEPFHVVQQLRPRRIADDLTEDVAEQPDIAPHQLRQRGAISVSFPVHGQSLIPRGERPASLSP